MKILSSNIIKILLLLFISFMFFAGWQAGMETSYAKLLVGSTNVCLDIVKTDTHIKLENADTGDSNHQFRVYTRIDGRKGNYPQETGGVMQPIVIILSWQVFLFFVLKPKRATISLAVNFGLFFLVQIIFLFLLTGYYTSSVQKYIYTIMLDSFYIIALILIIKDNILYSVFRK